VTLACTGCGTPLPAAVLAAPAASTCVVCRSTLEVAIFPALYRPLPEASAGDAVLTDGEASCFYHPGKRAVLPCDACGRFLCGLCDLDLSGRHLCVGCVESGRRQGRLTHLESRRTLYDRIALAVAIYPMLVFYFTLISAPIALYIALRYWKAPGSIPRPSRFRFVIAVVLAGLQLAGWVLLFVVLLESAGRSS
jgi:hypothetical protein